jgi:transposase
MAYSLDFRKRVFKVKDKEGLTFEATSKRFHIPIRTLFRWQQRLEPKTTRNKPATKVDMVALKTDIEKRPDAFLHERAALLEVSVSGVFYALRRLNISHKKNSVSPQG